MVRWRFKTNVFYEHFQTKQIVGIGHSNSTQYFNGSIDECGFSIRKLTGAQIATFIITETGSL
jgi:hypothetical protein